MIHSKDQLNKLRDQYDIVIAGGVGLHIVMQLSSKCCDELRSKNSRP